MIYVDFTQVEECTSVHNPSIKKRMAIYPQQLKPIVQMAQAVIPVGVSVEEHRHETMHEVFIVQSGNGVIEVDGKERSLAPNVCVVVAAGETHSLKNCGDEELVMLFYGVESANS